MKLITVVRGESYSNLTRKDPIYRWTYFLNFVQGDAQRAVERLARSTRPTRINQAE